MSASSTIFWLLVATLVGASLVFGAAAESRRDAGRDAPATNGAQ